MLGLFEVLNNCIGYFFDVDNFNFYNVDMGMKGDIKMCLFYEIFIFFILIIFNNIYCWVV